MLNITSRAPADKDDDGAAAGAPVPIDADQIAHIEKLLLDTNSNRELFLEYIGAASVEAMTVTQYKTALELFAVKKRKAAEATS